MAPTDSYRVTQVSSRPNASTRHSSSPTQSTLSTPERRPVIPQQQQQQLNSLNKPKLFGFSITASTPSNKWQLSPPPSHRASGPRPARSPVRCLDGASATYQQQPLKFSCEAMSTARRAPDARLAARPKSPHPVALGAASTNTSSLSHTSELSERGRRAERLPDASESIPRPAQKSQSSFFRFRLIPRPKRSKPSDGPTACGGYDVAAPRLRIHIAGSDDASKSVDDILLGKAIAGAVTLDEMLGEREGARARGGLKFKVSMRSLRVR